MEKVRIADIQLRLSIEIDGVVLVTSWYGPKDDKRFARVKKSEKPLTIQEVNEYEEKAKVLFSEKIKQFEEALEDIL